MGEISKVPSGSWYIGDGLVGMAGVMRFPTLRSHNWPNCPKTSRLSVTGYTWMGDGRDGRGENVGAAGSRWPSGPYTTLCKRVTITLRQGAILTSVEVLEHNINWAFFLEEFKSLLHTRKQVVVILTNSFRIFEIQDLMEAVLGAVRNGGTPYSELQTLTSLCLCFGTFPCLTALTCYDNLLPESSAERCWTYLSRRHDVMLRVERRHSVPSALVFKLAGTRCAMCTAGAHKWITWHRYHWHDVTSASWYPKCYA